MHVLLDTNVLISYLLWPDRSGNVHMIVRSAVAQKFTLLIPGALLDELSITVRQKPTLPKRIPPSELGKFLALLSSVGEQVNEIPHPIPRATRDPKDDYLLAYALVGQADYLVTGDKDLLVLSEYIDDLKIRTPRAFVEELL